MAACLALGACASTAKPSGSASRVGAAAPPTRTTQRTSTTGRAVKPPATQPARAHRTANNHATPQLKGALSSYTACLSRHGVNAHPTQPAKHAQPRAAPRASTNTPAAKKAIAACRPIVTAALRGAAKTLAPTTHAAHTHRQAIPAPTTAALKRFTTCMRNNGLPSFPQPLPGGGYNLIRAHINQATPLYKTAQAHCYHLL